MRPKPKPISQTQIFVEQMALLLASFIWTVVVLSPIVFFWVYQALGSDRAPISDFPDTFDAAPALALATEATATFTPWPTPLPSPTPTETLIPTATPTRIVLPPAILPETLNADEPTPIPIIVHTQEEIGDYLPTPAPEVGVTPSPTATPTAAPTATPTVAVTEPQPEP